jgi:hypothetical protein
MRFWARRVDPSPPLFFEPTPYCDRLTLAEAFHEDTETRATAEDLHCERLRPIQATTSVIPSRARR